MPVVKVLVVEDDDGIAQPLVEGLAREGYEPLRVGTVTGALAATGYELVLLDLRLPDGDGLDVCRQLRARSQVPIIVVSARGEEVDRVVGLEMGADDYLVKPFGMHELLARMRAVLRRTQASDSADADGDGQAIDPARAAAARQLVWGSLVLDPAAHRASHDGAPLQLTVKEFGLLEQLVAAQGATVARRELMERVWGTNWYGPSKTIDMHVANLRRKLPDPELVETVRGVGYRLRELS
jgi:two-component system, OmpR family, response regulator RegX3